MKDQLIKKAKDLGFNQSPKMPYLEAYYMWMSLLQKWLRDEHNIQINSWYDEDAGYQVMWEVMDGKGNYAKAYHYTTYDKALEKGLTEAMKLIKK